MALFTIIQLSYPPAHHQICARAPTLIATGPGHRPRAPPLSHASLPSRRPLVKVDRAGRRSAPALLSPSLPLPLSPSPPPPPPGRGRLTPSPPRRPSRLKAAEESTSLRGPYRSICAGAVRGTGTRDRPRDRHRLIQSARWIAGAGNGLMHAYMPPRPPWPRSLADYRVRLPCPTAVSVSEAAGQPADS